jgi:hypothetical protein
MSFDHSDFGTVMCATGHWRRWRPSTVAWRA